MPSDYFGHSLVGPGDVDGDGVPDVIIASPGAELGNMGWVGRLQVFSGRDGRELYSLSGTKTNELFGAILGAAGDVDGDGNEDFVASSTDVQSSQVIVTAIVFSGSTGVEIRRHTGHGGGIGVGDVNMDGIPDLLLSDNTVSVNGMPNAGRAAIVSGRDGTVIHSFLGNYAGEGLGGLISAGGDLDGDSVPDVLVAAVGDWPTTPRGGVYGYSGRTGARLFFLPPPSATDTFPAAISGAGDVDDDGFDDVLVTDRGYRWSPAYNDVNVYGGPSGTRIFSLRWNLVQNTSLGTYVCGPGDVDGDGHADALVLGRDVAFLVSGRDQSILFELHDRSVSGGHPSAPVGDVDGDDFPDLLIGGFLDAQLVRAVRIYSGAPPGVTTIGIGCADTQGRVPRVGASHRPEPGKPFALNLARTLPGKPAALVIGLSDTSWGGVALPLDLALIGLPGCFLRSSVDLVVSTVTQGTSSGHASVGFTFPPDPGLTGAKLFAQWLVLDPATRSASTTRALAITVQ